MNSIPYDFTETKTLDDYKSKHTKILISHLPKLELHIGMA